MAGEGRDGMEELIRWVRTARKPVDRSERSLSELAGRGMEAFSGTPESFDKFLKDQLVVWEKLIRDAKIEKQ